MKMLPETRLSYSFRRWVESIRARVKTLSSLRKLVALPLEHDITERQWSVLESQLSSVETRILSRLKREAGIYLPYIHDARLIRKLSYSLGEIELEMSRAFTFFDTYMDVLTQRHTPELGPSLAGCDILAWDAINKDHPALELVEPPLVYCDRGFGASILREGVMLPDLIPNPMPLIQIPYSRLKEKYNLISVIHEVGHQAMVRIGLVSVLPKVIRFALSRAGADNTIEEVFALWSSEIGADFWAFCATGMAQSASIKEVLALPPDYIFRISWTDSHPTPYLRVLLSFEWCRQMWGRGEWDDWERNWLDIYRLEDAPDRTQKLLKRVKEYLPTISRALLNTKFRILGRKPITELFDLSSLAPSELRRYAEVSDSETLLKKGISPCIQLAAFRLIRERGNLKDEILDRIMTEWLLKLGKRRGNL